jgi:hypothetical protein
MNKKLIFFYSGLFALLVLIIFSINKFDSKVEAHKPVFQKDYNGLIVSVDEKPYLTKDKDTKKIIINIPITISNTSDHGFLISPMSAFYNDNKYVGSGFLNDDVDEDSLDTKISTGDEKSGVVKILLDTREEKSIKSVNPLVTIEDLSTDKKKKISHTFLLNN